MARDEVGHGLICSPGLHLKETRLLATALEACEKAFLVTLAILFLLPISPPSLQVHLKCLLSLVLLGLTGKLVCVHLYNCLVGQITTDDALAQLGVLLVVQVEKQ